MQLKMANEIRNDKMRIKMGNREINCELKRQNANQNVKTQVQMTRRKLKREDFSQKRKMRIEIVS